MSKINLRDKLAVIQQYWTPKLIAEVNDTDVKLAKIKGEFEWHHHPHEDELFLVLRGRLNMQFRDREEWIEEGEMIVVPRGTEHRPVAPEEAHILLVEPKGTLNTGHRVTERTVARVERI
jgi:mannose-6-phosphate isomerase-like protein (cupin superfamily)